MRWLEISRKLSHGLTYVDRASWPDNIGNVRDRGTRGSTEVEHLRTRLHVNCLQTTEDTSGKLASAVTCQRGKARG